MYHYFLHFSLFLILVPVDSFATELIVECHADPIDISYPEPILLQYRLSNQSSSTLAIDLGQDRKGSLRFLFIDANGKEKECQFPLREGIGLIPIVSIPPTAAYTQIVILNEPNMLLPPGSYVLEVKSVAVAKFETGEVKAIPPCQVPIHVTPRDVKRLRQDCDALAYKVVSASGYQAARDAAEELVSIPDLECLPSVEQALRESRLVTPILITGLQKQINSESVRILAGALRDKDADKVSQARSALLAMRGQASAELRGEIDQVLRQK